MTSVKCPFCRKLQKDKPIKSWSYGTLIEKKIQEKTIWGSSIKCSRYICKCGKSFNFYLTQKGKSWTNPKPQSESLGK